MTKEKALVYLKYLHELEQEHSKSLFGEDMRLQIQEIRFEFLKLCNDIKCI